MKAVLVIDMQAGMADRIREGRPTATPDAPDRITALLAHAGRRGIPVIHIQPDDPHVDSPFRKGQPGGEPMPCALPQDGEAVFWKHGSSACHGTGLDAYLKAQGITELVIAGALAAFCITSSVRQASDLGYHVLLPQDALLGLDLPAHDGGRIDARTVFRVTLSLLGTDFATLTTVDAVAA